MSFIDVVAGIVEQLRERLRHVGATTNHEAAKVTGTYAAARARCDPAGRRAAAPEGQASEEPRRPPSAIGARHADQWLTAAWP